MRRLLGILLIVIVMLIAPQLFTKLGDFRNATIIFLFALLIAIVTLIFWLIRRQEKK